MPNSEEEWRATSNDFGKRWNFPNCIGAIDGKHVLIKKPAKSGSFYFNYKKTFSIVLMAVVNANYEFIVVEAGTNGRVSDGGVLTNSSFYEKFNNDKLKLPKACQLHDDFQPHMPFVLVGDDAFPLQENLMKPYSGDNISPNKVIFNYRLSRARRIVENAFGILASRFRVLLNVINLSPEKATIITLTACYLHNFLRRNNSSIYLRGSVDVENTSTTEMQLAPWRNDSQQMTELQPTLTRNPSSNAKNVRDNFNTYFNGVGAVTWQDRYINK